MTLPAALSVPWPAARSARAALSVDARTVPVSQKSNAGAVPTFGIAPRCILDALLGKEVPAPGPL